MESKIKQLIESLKSDLLYYKSFGANTRLAITTEAHNNGRYDATMAIVEKLEQLLSEPKVLPESWAVFNDGSPLFYPVLQYIKRIDNGFIKYWNIVSHNRDFFGVNKKGLCINSHNSNDFDTILTIEQFIELTKK